MSNLAAIYVQPTQKLENRQKYIEENFVLQNNLEVMEKKYAQIRVAYKKHSALLVQRTERIDEFKAELCDKTIQLNQVTKQLNDKNELYSALFAKYVALEKKQELMQKQSRAINYIDSLILRYEQYQEQNKASQVSFFKRVLGLFSKALKREKTKTIVQKVALVPENNWFPVKNAMPAFNGMYRISDGKSSVLSYFSSESHEFASKDYSIKYWQPVF